jgi:DNA-binding NarL/FixJ family response regulator
MTAMSYFGLLECPVTSAIVADGNPIRRYGLASMAGSAELRIVASVASIDEICRLFAEPARAQVLVLSDELGDTAELVECIHLAGARGVRTIVYGNGLDASAVARIFGEGADGYVEVPGTMRELARLLARVARTEFRRAAPVTLVGP